MRWMLPRFLLACCLVVLAAVFPVAPTAADTPAGSVLVSGVDLHDGMVARFPASPASNGDTYFMYGTEYGCGYGWKIVGTPWCGFGVSHAPALGGPWSAPQPIGPAPSDINAFEGTTWSATCAQFTNAGCFNARMALRPDGKFVFSFNAPGDRLGPRGVNPYYFAGCDGPTSGCGSAGNNGWTKPRMYVCTGAGDYGLYVENGAEYLYCTDFHNQLSVEQLDAYWVNGTGNVAGHSGTALAGLPNAEGVGVWLGPDGKRVMTYSDPQCGYCTGVETGYATADNPIGPWTYPDSASSHARRDLSTTSCGGQPRTVTVVDGQPVEWIDLWIGGPYQPTAGVYLLPLGYDPALQHGTPGDGGLWHPPFPDFTCAADIVATHS